MFKVIVAGSRGFHDYKVLEEQLDLFLLDKNKEEIEIVSGHATGADTLGELYAKNHNLQVKLFPADWKMNGKQAGYIRNQEMAEYADACICFWDGSSRGTTHMINLSKKHNLILKVIKYIVTNEEK